VKRCTRCQKQRPLSDFSRDAQKPDGLRYWCRDCERDYQSDRKKADPKLLAAAAAYLQKRVMMSE
jgi:hypothetical protein